MIILSDTLYANQSNETETMGVSFTRNKNEAYSDIYLKIDQEKLSHNYKIHPVYRDGIAGRDLAEERVDKTIKNISKYIIEVGMSNYFYLRYFDRMLKKNSGNPDYVLKNDDKYPDSWKHQSSSLYYYNKLIQACYENNIKIDDNLKHVKNSIDEFLSIEKDDIK